MSPEKAAPLTGVIGPSQWRNIESGKTSAKDEVLAHMASVVRVTPGDLEGVGKFEAAEILRRIERDKEPDRDIEATVAEDEAWMDEQYAAWKADRDRKAALKALFKTGADHRDAV